MNGNPASVDDLIALLRRPGIAERPIRTAGDLADVLDAAYRAARYRPAPPRPAPKPIDRTRF